ncbi:MAG TPA: helix-turn-helix domain-containing protein [Pseudonocardia sp.]|nr:helix-turn-helix domain-containing protein [Pseudonocardia sp.]
MSRRYDDPCGAARALDVIGERWALLVVRELLLGPKRFRDLTRGLPTASPNVLSQRLRELEGAGVLRRCRVGPPASVRAYELTERGRELEPVLVALGGWGRALAMTTSAELSPDALVLALRTTFRPEAAAGLLAWVELRTGGDRFALAVADGRLELGRGGVDDSDAVLEADVGVLREVALQGRPLDEALAAGTLTVTGSRRTAARVLACFAGAAPG